MTCWSSAASRSAIRRALRASSRVVGSSATRIAGSVTSTAASASSCFCPPESRCVGWSARLGEVEPFERGATRAAASAFDELAAAQRERDVLGDGRHHDLVVRVGEDEADPAADLAPVPGGVEAVDRDRAGGRLHQPVDHPGQGGLAGAVGADDADARSVQREVDAVARTRSRRSGDHPGERSITLSAPRSSSIAMPCPPPIAQAASPSRASSAAASGRRVA